MSEASNVRHERVRDDDDDDDEGDDGGSGCDNDDGFMVPYPLMV